MFKRSLDHSKNPSCWPFQSVVWLWNLRWSSSSTATKIFMGCYSINFWSIKVVRPEMIMMSWSKVKVFTLYYKKHRGHYRTLWYSTGYNAPMDWYWFMNRSYYTLMINLTVCHLLAACLLMMSFVVIYTVNDSHILQDDLSCIEDCADKWMMIFNTDKL